MNILKFIKSRGVIAVTLSVVMSFAFVAVAVNGATTISTNVSTGGTLSVTGASTLTGLTSMIQASSTRMSVFDTAYFGGSATSTFDSSGNLSVIGTLGVTGVSTLTGRTDMIQASSTRMSVFDTAYFGGSATSTFSSTGALTLITDLTLQNGETISNSTNGTITLGATNMVLVGTASTSAIKVGNGASPSTISGLVFGYCTVADIAITASTSAFMDCTGATGVVSGDKIFIQATSSLPARVYVQSASSTATAGTIQLQLFNTGIDAGDVATAVESFNFWAVR
jgi:hypothetical protein